MSIIKILIYLFITNVYAFEAVVINNQTPLFLKESEQAEISEYRIRGEILFVHGSYNTDPKAFRNDDFNQTKFYRSIDRIGRNVYVKASDLFIYFNDEREIQTLTE